MAKQRKYYEIPKWFVGNESSFQDIANGDKLDDVELREGKGQFYTGGFKFSEPRVKLEDLPTLYDDDFMKMLEDRVRQREYEEEHPYISKIKNFISNIKLPMPKSNDALFNINLPDEPINSGLSPLSMKGMVPKQPVETPKIPMPSKENPILSAGKWLGGNIAAGALGAVEGILNTENVVNKLGEKYVPDWLRTKGIISPENMESAAEAVKSAREAVYDWSGNEEKGPVQKFVGDTISSIPQMALNFIPGVGPALFGVSAAGNYAKDAEEKGANIESQAIQGLVGGVGETGLNKLLGIIPGYKKLFEEAFKGGIGSLTKASLKEYGKFGKELLKNMVKEGIEEAAIDPIMGLSEKLTFDNDKPIIRLNNDAVFNISQMGLDALGGMLMSGMLEGPAVGRHAYNIKKARDYITNELPNTISAAKMMPDEYNSNKLADKLIDKGINNVTVDDINNLKDVIKEDMQRFISEQKNEPIEIQKETITEEIPQIKELETVNESENTKEEPAVEKVNPIEDNKEIYKSNVKPVNVSEINVDPERFQFKMDVDKNTGAGKTLDISKWDDNLSGVITVWEDKDGKLWVVNGHHRLQKAKEFGVKSLNARILRESDGISEKQAREIGAKINIAEGHGTATDAAKLFREGGYTLDDIIESGLPLKGGNAKKGYSIAQLNDRLFDKVVSKKLTEDKAAIIGEGLPTDNGGQMDAKQNTIYDYIEGKRISNEELKELVDAIRETESKAIEQETLFGTMVTFGDSFIQKSKLIAEVKSKLTSDKGAFNKLVKKSDTLKKAGNILNDEENAKRKAIIERALEFIDRGKNKSGDPINDIFNKYTELVTRGGMKLSDAAEQAESEITDYISKGDFLNKQEDKGNIQLEGQQTLFGGNVNEGASQEGTEQTDKEDIGRNKTGEGENREIQTAEGTKGDGEKDNTVSKDVILLPNKSDTKETNKGPLSSTGTSVKGNLWEKNGHRRYYINFDNRRRDSIGYYDINKDEFVKTAKYIKMVRDNDIITFTNISNEDAYKIILDVSSFKSSNKSKEDISNNIHEVQQTESKSDNQKTETQYDEQKTNLVNSAKGDEKSYNISRKVVELLNKKEKITWNELFKIADEVYGGTQAEGKYSVKDAYDALELGVNLYLLEQKDIDLTTKDVDVAKENVKKLEELMELLPTQTKRTDEQEKFQQFSTPPTIAYIASYVANMNKNDVVLEPSAGIGGLALFGKANGSKVVVNELSKRRLEVLKNMDFDMVFNEDAEQIDNILPNSINPTVVIMNPPFSTAANRGIKNNKNIINHVEQALLRLEDGGRLVVISGDSFNENTATFSDWFKKIKENYNVRASVGIDGANYTKYGTSFDIRLTVIDKTGKTEGNIIKGEFKNLDDILDVLEGVKNDRRTTGRNNKYETSEPNSKKADEGSKDKGRPVNDIHTATDELGNKKEGNDSIRGPQNEKSDGRRNRNTYDNKSGESLEDNDGGHRRRGISKANEGAKDNTGSSGVSDRGSARTSGSNGDNRLEETEEELIGEKTKSTKKDIGDSTYNVYEPEYKIKGAQKHPTPLAQSAAMAAVNLPEISYVPNIPKEIIEKGILSDAQLESVSYAGAAHEQILPDGRRRGFFIGDGTGVGKGRQIAAIILDNFMRGRKKAVWISAKDNLYVDAQRDWMALGGNKQEVLNLRKVKNGKISTDEGILFTTYDTLKSGLNYSNPENLTPIPGKPVRIDQIINWLGKDFDGVIVFDEAHKMGNAIETKGKMGKKAASNTALAGIELQKRLPKARIVYVSATGATEVHNLAYAERLGLWGKGTPFAHVRDFVGKISEGGLAVMELVARDMKAMGVYIARTLSFDGIKYETLEHTLTKEQEEIYNELAKAWQIVLQNIDKALEETNGSKSSKAKANARGRFWNSQQAFFNQILTSMQMPSVIEQIKKDLENGESAVLQLVNTNEASLNRQLASLEEGESLEDLDMTPRDILMQYIEKSFPTEQYVEVEDENGNTKYVVAKDSQGNVIHNKQALRMKEELLDRLGAIKVPVSAMDMVIEAFGVENVAEITGRKRRVVTKYNEKTGRYEKQIENRSDAIAAADVQDFLDDKKRILIFNDKGGTGKSYHADKNEKNQRHRRHYLIQAGWRADNAIQGFGRTHRTNEASQPTYILVTTNLKGQKRFISTIARRLDQLGALTKGQRQTGGQGIFSERDNLESPTAKDALYNFYLNLIKGRIDGLDPKEVLTKMGLLDKFTNEYGELIMNDIESREVNKFLNRLLPLESSLQNKVFDAFSDILDLEIQTAIQSGTLDTGLENFKANRVEKVNEIVVRKDPINGAETKYIHFKAYHKNKKVSFDDELKYSKSDKNFIGFYKNTRSGNIFAVYKSANKTKTDGSIVEMVRLSNQIATGYRYEEKKSFDKGSFEKITDIDTARRLWDEAYNKAPEYKEEEVHMISGVLLPIWDRLPSGINRVMRILTDDGDVHLGRIIPESSVDETLRRLDTKRKIDTSAKTIVDNILNKGYTVKLVNGWRLVRSRVSNENRIELKGDNLYPYMSELMEDGLFTERIQYTTRYFVPLANAEEVIQKLTEFREVDSMYPSTTTESEGEYASYGTTTKHLPMPGTSNGPVTLRRDIINKLLKALDIPGRVGRVKGRQLGVYKNKPLAKNVIRTKFAEDMETIPHEVGHGLDNLFGIISSVKDNKDIENELVRLGEEQAQLQNLKGNRKRHIQEGIAEFVRYYLTDRSAAERLAPNFYNWFKEKLKNYPEIDMALNTYIEEYKNYMGATPEERFAANISRDTDKKKKFSFDDFMEKMVDELHKIKVFEKLTAKDKVNVSDSVYNQAWLYRGWVGKAKNALYNGIYDKNGNLVGKSLKDILDPVKDDIENFTNYIVAKRVVEKEGQGILTGFRLEDAEAIIEKYESPKFAKAFQELQEYNDALLNMLKEYGMLSQEQIDNIKEMNKNYVPFYRVFEEEGAISKLGKNKFANLNNPVKKMKGSTASIIDPLESIIKNTYYIINMAERNNVGRTLLEFSRKNDVPAEFVEKVDPKKYAVSVPLEDISKKLAEYNVEMPVEALEDIALIFKTSYTPSSKDNILVVYEDGKPTLLKLDKELYQAMLMLDKESTHWLINIVFGTPTRLLRKGAVLTPEFITRNPFRDIGTAVINSKYGFFLQDFVKGLYHAIKGHTVGDRLYELYLQSGAANSDMASLERDYLREDLTKILESGEAKGIFDIWKKDPMLPLEVLSSILEEATRLGEFSKALKKEGISQEGLQRAALAARDITLDFARKGSQGGVLNQMIAFFNANVQGLDKFRRTFFEKQDGKINFRPWIRSGLFITIPSMILWFLFHDDDKIKELPAWRKDLFWNIPYGDKIYSIPKPPLYGQLFGSLAERFLSFAYENDKEGFKDYADSLISNTTPNWIPTALLPLIEATTDYSFFQGRSTKSMSDMRLPEYKDYNNYTSETAKLIGKTFNVSPTDVETIVKGYTGGIGKYGLDLMDKALSLALPIPKKPKSGAENMPVLKAFVYKAYTQADSINKFYEEKDRLDKKYNAILDDKKEGKKTLPMPAKEDARRKEMGKVSQELSDIRKEIDKIFYDTKLSPEQKRKKIDELNKEMVKKAREALK